MENTIDKSTGKTIEKTTEKTNGKTKKGVRLEHISKIYKDPKTGKDFYAVKDTSLEIEPGSFVTLLGPSGCGKTTTLRMIAGFESPDEGEIYLGDEAINALTPNKRDTAMVFQSYALLPHYNIFDNVAYGLKLRKMPKDVIREKVMKILDLVELTGMEARMTNQLSGGQQQRVALARALVIEPSVLLFDEPLSNLDAKLRADMRTELKRLHVDTNSTFIYVTHDQLEAMSLSTKICLMNKGVVQQYDSPLTVYERPSNLFVADFVGNPTINVIKGLAGKVEDSKAPIEVLGHRFEFVSEQSLGLLPKDVFVGIRPEFITICEGGVVRGHVYSTLPAGMETTVKVDVGGEMISSVVFGSRDFLVDSELGFDITGDKILLFDAESGCNSAVGSLSYIG